MPGLQALGERTHGGQIDAVIVAAFFIGRPQLRIFQRGQFGHDARTWIAARAE
jgi:hypothetical protein